MSNQLLANVGNDLQFFPEYVRNFLNSNFHTQETQQINFKTAILTTDAALNWQQI